MAGTRGVADTRVGFAALTIAVLFCPGHAFADSVSTSATSGFARILFTLDPVSHGAVELSGGVLTVHFDRKVAIDPAALSQNLGDYISTARLDPDGQTFRLALAQTIKPHTSMAGNRIAVDLAPPSFNGTPPDLPLPAKPATVDPSKLPALAIRAGAYSNYSRLVFDWPQAVRYTLQPRTGHLTIKFFGLAAPDYAALDRIAPPWIKAAGWRISGEATILEFQTDPGSSFRDSHDGGKVTLDVLAPKTDAAALGVVSPEQKQQIAQAAAELNDLAQTAAPATPAPSHPVAAAPKSGFADVPSAPKSVVPNIAPPPPVAPPPPPPSVAANRIKDGIALHFAHASAAAAFIRAGTAWILVEGTPGFDSASLKSQLGDFPASFDGSFADNMAIIHIGLKLPEQISAHAEGAGLKVVVAPVVTPAAAPISLARDDDAGKPALAAILPGADRALSVADAVVGDNLVIVPSAPGRAMPEQRNYLEFTALPTAAGLVVRAQSDDLNVTAANSRVSIARPGGLALTPSAAPVADAPSALVIAGAGPTFMDFPHWSGTGGDLFQTQRKLLQAAASKVPPDAYRAQLALARFYLAHRFGAEALGTIRLMQISDPALQSQPQFQVMRAVAEYMMGRYHDAESDLGNVGLEEDPHANLWRGLTDAALENWVPARRAFERANSVVRLYPSEWRLRASLDRIVALVETGSTDAASHALAHLPKDLPQNLLLEAELLRAKLLSRLGNSRGAAPLFQAVEEGGDEKLAARATYERIEAGLAAQHISRSDAAESLERLRFRWRGDDLELKTLRALGSVYFAQADWRNGLQTLRIASTNFPDSDVARQAQDDMRATFENLFLKGSADRLSPIDALGLFYDFIDLTPIGPNGDEMIRRMADRLIAVDLLGPAATLLKYQADKRLDGLARAQVATRLAMIDLLDHQPRDALAALRDTRITGLPDSANHQRLLLEARALAALKQWDQAVELIAVDDAPDTKVLRADIYWESGQWDLAGQKTEDLLAADGASGNPLSAADQSLLMRAAISYSLAADQPALDRLRTRFSNAVQTGADASAFAMITQKIDTQDVTFRAAAARIASTDTLESFMKDFQRRYTN